MSPILMFIFTTLALFSFRSPAKALESSIEEEPELLSSSVDQTSAVSNDHDYTNHAPINDQLLASQAKEKIMNLQRKFVTVEKRLFSLERFTKDPQTYILVLKIMKPRNVYMLLYNQQRLQ